MTIYYKAKVNGDGQVVFLEAAVERETRAQTRFHRCEATGWGVIVDTASLGLRRTKSEALGFLRAQLEASIANLTARIDGTRRQLAAVVAIGLEE